MNQTNANSPASPPSAAAPALTGTPQSEIRPPKSALQRARVYRLFWTIAIAVLVLDQLTKALIVALVPFGHSIPHDSRDIEVVRGFFYIIHVGNTGAAWSMFSGQGVFLALLAAVTLVAIFYWRHSLGLRDRATQISFGLLCGGIVGNLIDRLIHGHVIDFIDLHFGPRFPAMFDPYPTFNVADSGICIGVILYLWMSLRAPREAQTPNPKSPNAK